MLNNFKIMYLVFGIMTVSWGIAIFLLMPDNPMSSRLGHDEKIVAIERLRSNQTGIENTTFKVGQMNEALKDIKTWIIVVIILAANVPTGISGSYSSTVIKGCVLHSSIFYQCLSFVIDLDTLRNNLLFLMSPAVSYQ